MTFRATTVASDPLDYFLYHRDTLHITDVVLRENKNPKEIFAAAIRLATGSKWSHSAIVYLVSDPPKGFHNAFLIEDTTKGTHLTSWRYEVVPYKQFTVGIKRPRLEWYVETPFERARHDPCDPEDRYGIDYLRHVRGIALDQLNARYDRKTVFELAALYAKRIAWGVWMLKSWARKQVVLLEIFSLGIGAFELSEPGVNRAVSLTYIIMAALLLICLYAGPNRHALSWT